MGSGGAERVVALLTDDFVQRGINVHLLVLDDNQAYDVNDKVTYVKLSKGENKPLWRQMMNNFFVHPIRIKKYCDENNIEIVMSHLFRSNCANAISKWLGNKAIALAVQHSHASNSYSGASFKDRFNRMCIKYIFPKVDLISSVSQVMKLDLKHYFEINEDKLHYIGNPIQLNRINKLAKQKEKKVQNRFTFITLGSFIQRKNHQLIIRAAAMLPHLDFEIIIMGKGELKQFYTNLIKDLNVQDKIRLIDFDQNPFKYMAGSSCLINSSNAEGLPMVILEALACELPVISSDCLSGPREILAPTSDLNKRLNAGYEIADHGILFPINNVEALASSMEIMMKDANMRTEFIKRSKERSQEFDVSKISAEYYNLIKELYARVYL